MGKNGGKLVGERGMALARWTLSILVVISALGGCNTPAKTDLRSIAETGIASLMKEHQIPGVAIAVVHDGRTDIFCRGVASAATGDPVTSDTLFELGSVSKTFTALLASYASRSGAFAPEDPASMHWSALAGSAFDRVTMDQLGTYTPGGLPLQFPPEVRDDAGMLEYFRAWTPDYPPGTRRTYSNPSIALYGHIAAMSAGRDFVSMMTADVFPQIGLRDTYLRVPESRMTAYAWGVDDENRPTRQSPGVLDAEAYGVRSTASDMAKYMRYQIELPSEPVWRDAVLSMRKPRYAVGPMTQALGWELYPYPVPIEDLIAGNSSKISLKPNPTTPARQLTGSVLMNKTGATSGFSSYVAIVPARKIGVVILVNRFIPSEARVRLAHAILESADRGDH